MNELIEGASVKIGGKTFIVPALNFKRLKKLREELKLLSSANLSEALSDTQLEASITIIHTALTRNYPDLTRDDIEEMVDFCNLPVIMAAIMGQSGMVRTMGEDQPGTVTDGLLTGTSSIAS